MEGNFKCVPFVFLIIDIVIPEQVAIKLVNSTKVTPEEFVKMVKKQTENAQKKDNSLYDVKELIELPPSVPDRLFELKTKYLASSSTTPTPSPDKDNPIDSMQEDQEMEDADDGMDFEMESSGQGVPISQYNTQTMNTSNDEGREPQLANDNEI